MGQNSFLSTYDNFQVCRQNGITRIAATLKMPHTNIKYPSDGCYVHKTTHESLSSLLILSARALHMAGLVQYFSRINHTRRRRDSQAHKF